MIELFVAWDSLCANEHRTRRIMSQFSNLYPQLGFKINLDYVLKYGIDDFYSRVSTFGNPIFLDLKMWNGERTMKAVLEQMKYKSRIVYVTVHALGGWELASAVGIAKSCGIRILATTVLSHYDDSYCRWHFGKSLRESVVHFAEVAYNVGCYGVVVPGMQLDAVSKIPIIKVSSGIRPAWFKDSRHKQEATPTEAVRGGAKVLVCGSPIMKSDNPPESLERIIAEVEEAGEVIGFA